MTGQTAETNGDGNRGKKEKGEGVEGERERA